MRERDLDFLTPYTSVRYLSASDTQGVMQGVCDAAACRPVNVLPSGTGASGGIGLVRSLFLQRHGGLVEGFRGWGGEDNAWNHKIALLGRAGYTRRRDQHVHHLYHPASGGYEPRAAGRANPHYAANVELMRRVCAVRKPAEFATQFPPAQPASGGLTRFDLRAARHPDTVWAYWEGPCPAWIRACLRTLAMAAPTLQVLTPEAVDRLRDSDRDIDLSRLQVAHRADFVRLYLLQRYGGLWVDADCLALQPLQGGTGPVAAARDRRPSRAQRTGLERFHRGAARQPHHQRRLPAGVRDLALTPAFGLDVARLRAAFGGDQRRRQRLARIAVPTRATHLLERPRRLLR